MAPTNRPPGDRLVGLLSGFAIRGILMTGFLILVYAAVNTPGTGFPEVGALVALFVLLGVPLLTGYGEWYEVLAVMLGVVLIAVELFVIPGFGVAGITGLGLLFGGLLMTFVGPITLPTPGYLPGVAEDGAAWTFDLDGLKYGATTIILGMAMSLGLWFWLSRYLPHMPYMNKLILNDVTGQALPSDAGSATPSSPPLPLGTVGVAVSDLYPGGQVKFNDKVFDVLSDRGFVDAGAKVVVREAGGNRIVVRKV